MDERWSGRVHGRLISGLLRHRIGVLAAAVVCALLAAWGLSRFRIEPDVAAFYPKGDPTARLSYQLYGNASPKRVMTIVFRAPDPAAIDEAMPSVIERLGDSPYLTEIVATREAWLGQRLAWVEQAPLYFLSNAARGRLRSLLMGPDRRAALERSRKQISDDPVAGGKAVLKDPLGLRWVFEEAKEELSAQFPARLRRGSPYLLFDDPPIGIVRVTGREDWSNFEFSGALIRDVRKRLESALLGKPVAFELGEAYASAAFASERLKTDLNTQTLLATALVILFLGYFTRSWIHTLLILTPVAISILCTLGFAGIVLGPLTPLTVSVAAILLAQGLDFALHFHSRYRQSRESMRPEAAFEWAHRSLARPQAGAALTTAIAFLALLASRFPGIHQFGVILCLGMIFCLIASLTLFPILTLLIDRVSRSGAGSVPFVVAVAERASRSRARVPIAMGIGLLGAVGWIYAGTTGIRVDLDPNRLAPRGDPGEVVVAKLEADLGFSATPAFMLFEEGASFEGIRASCDQLRREGVIAWADGPHRLLPGEQDRAAMAEFLQSIDGWVERTIAEMAAMGFRTKPFRPGLEDLDSRFRSAPPTLDRLLLPEFGELRGKVRFEENGRRHWVVYTYPKRTLVEPHDRRAFDRAVSRAFNQTVRILSADHVPDHYARLLEEDLYLLGGLAVLTVALTGIAIMGTVRGGLLALIPALVATGIVLAECFLLGGAINLVNLIAIPITIGIGVDDGIYFVSHVRRQQAGDVGSAISDVGPGLWGSTATTVLGFGAVMISVSPGLASMGFLVATGRCVSLGAALFLLPALVRIRPEDDHRRRETI